MPRRSFFRVGGGDGGSGEKKSKKQNKRLVQQLQQQQASVPLPSAINNNNNNIEPPQYQSDLAVDDLNEPHQNYDRLYRQHQTQSPVSSPPVHERRLHYDYEATSHGQQDAHMHQINLSHSIYQPNNTPTESIKLEASQKFNMLHRIKMHDGYNIPTHHRMTSAVDDAVDDIWRCETGNFRSASHAIQNLRLAILAEWRSRQSKNIKNNGTKARSEISYDPSDTFLSLQGATLRFHARFESMKAERYADQVSRKMGALHFGDESQSVADSATVNTNSQSLNGVEWELTEQAAWEVWEEAIRASATLAHACVGPAWHRQLKLRRQLLRERLPHQQFVDIMHVDCSGSGEPMSSFSPDTTMKPSSEEGAADPSFLQPHMDVLDLTSCAIPEVLPAAMIRFAASVLETSIPPLRLENTKFFWDSPEKSGIVLEDNERFLSSLDQHLQDERRWLRRRKRLCDAQR